MSYKEYSLDLCGESIDLHALEFIVGLCNGASERGVEKVVLENPGKTSYINLLKEILKGILEINLPTVPSEQEGPIRLSEGSEVVLPSGEVIVVDKIRSIKNNPNYMLKVKKQDGDSARQILKDLL